MMPLLAIMLFAARLTRHAMHAPRMIAARHVFDVARVAQRYDNGYFADVYCTLLFAAMPLPPRCARYR